MRASLLSLLALLPAFPAQAAPKDYDLVVYGGTSGGIAAAVQAARLGKSVILIEPGKHLGGLTSGGLGATDIGNKAAIGGIRREFYQRIRKHYADDANWKHEKRADFKGHGHDARRTPPGPSSRTSPSRSTTICCANTRSASSSSSGST